MVLVILASHSLLAHKEIRFLYPLYPLMVVLAALGAVELAKVFKTLWNWTPGPKMIVAAGLIVFGLTSALLASLAVIRGRWTEQGGLIGLVKAGQDPHVCGVALYGVPWFETGGYAYLHRNVPMLQIPQGARLSEELNSFNFALTKELLPYPVHGFQLQDCWNGVCLYRRSGSCELPQHYEINELLRQQGK
jgi:phosphatidylinositol glycan class B